MTITQVFELPEVGQKLLILGEPGSGKTTTLLELAQNLVEKALKEAEAPIPILVNLSSWKDPKQPNFDWLVGELKSKYGVRQELGRQFLIQNRLLPFLDGLDEVTPSLQESCALGLNAWLTGDVEQQPIGTVVCCRRKEYEEIVRKRLILQNSVSLQPLNDRQIETYLTQFQLGTVWESVQASPQLQDLLRKPLFLAVFGFVSPKFDFSEWQRISTNNDARIEYLFDRFWQISMERALLDNLSYEQGILSETYGKKPLPSRKKVKRALVFMARSMKHESQAEFLIEKIQPSWLGDNRRKKNYELTFKLILGLIIGFPFGLTVGLIFKPFLGLILGFTLGLSTGMLAGTAKELERIEPIEGIRFSISQFIKKGFWEKQKDYILVALVSGLIFFLISGPKLVLAMLLVISLNFLAIQGLKREIEDRDRISYNYGIKKNVQNMVVLIVASLIISVPIVFLLREFLPNSGKKVSEIIIVVPVSLAVSSFYFGGGKALLQHIALRIILARNGYAPYRYDKLLDYCWERLLLQRIGGRYRFMHKFLKNHFAKMPLD